MNLKRKENGSDLINFLNESIPVIYAPTNTRQFSFFFFLKKKREKLHYIFLPPNHQPLYFFVFFLFRLLWSNQCDIISNVILVSQFFLIIFIIFLQKFLSSLSLFLLWSHPSFLLLHHYRIYFVLWYSNYSSTPISPLVLFEWTWFI